MARPKVFTIGSATFDIFAKPEKQSVIEMTTPDTVTRQIGLEYGAKVRVDEVHETFGGGGANTAVGFARMGYDVAAVAKVGELYGDRVLANLAHEGVNTKFVQKTKRDKTAFSVIMNIFDGDRTILAYPGANRFFAVKDLPLEELQEADLIYLGHLAKDHTEVGHALVKLLDKNPHIKLAWNPGHEQFLQGLKKCKGLLAHTDMLFLNKQEAAEFTGIPYRLAGNKQDDPECHLHTVGDFLPPYADDVSEIVLEFFKYGVKNVVITDGRNGAQASDGKRLYFCPIVTHKRVDTVGAGDSFATGFASAMLEGKSLKHSLLYGTLNAHSVVSYYGAQQGLLSKKELEKAARASKICVTSSKLT